MVVQCQAIWHHKCSSNMQKQKSIAVIQRGEKGWAMKDTYYHWQQGMMQSVLLVITL